MRLDCCGVHIDLCPGSSIEEIGIVWGNRPAQDQVYNDNVTPRITYSEIEGGFSGTGNMNVDPRLDVFGDYGGPTWVFALLSSSPVID